MDNIKQIRRRIALRLLIAALKGRADIPGDKKQEILAFIEREYGVAEVQNG